MSLRTHYELRTRRSFRFHESDVPEAFRSLVGPLVNNAVSRGTKFRGRKREVLESMLLSLVSAGLRAAAIHDSRDTRTADVRFRVKLWDALEQGGWLTKCLGSEKSGRQTRYAPTPQLLRLTDLWARRLMSPQRLPRNSRLARPVKNALVVIQDRRATVHGGDAPARITDFRALSPCDRCRMKRTERQLLVINSRNSKYTWEVRLPEGVRFEPEFRLREIHSRQPWNATRLYTSGMLSIQRLPQELRLRTLINKEPVCELDFSGSIPRLLYHLYAKAEGDADIYSPEKVFSDTYDGVNVTDHDRALLRRIVKQSTIRCISVGSRKSAHSAVGKLLTNLPRQERALVLHQLCSDGAAKNLVERIVNAHPVVAKYFFRGVGRQLMTVESRIMLEILNDVTASGLPAVSIHDSVLCLRTDMDDVEIMMRAAYFRRTGFHAAVSRKLPMDS